MTPRDRGVTVHMGADLHKQLEEWVQNHPVYSLRTPAAWIEAAEAFRPTKVALRNRHARLVANGPKHIKMIYNQGTYSLVGRRPLAASGGIEPRTERPHIIY